VTSEQTKRRASDARKAKDHDPKQRKLSFVPRGKKGAKAEKRPREFIDLESEEVGCGDLILISSVYLSASSFSVSDFG
jgi:hypothetical protein